MPNRYNAPLPLENRAVSRGTKEEIERRIEEKTSELAKDYDLSDLNSNDRMVLRALVQTLISLEDYETMAYQMRNQEQLDIETVEKLNRVLSSLRSDVSKLQDDLKITRKVRQNDKEESMLAMIDSTLKKAKEFYESRMAYVFCPTCNMLLATLWVINPKEKKNKITLYCTRPLENGDICGTTVNVGTKELYDKRGTNNTEVMPENLL
jgi:hypothetical protein